jgi:2TM domain
VRASARWVLRTYRWHRLAFVSLNASLGLMNVFIGRSWWSFWPLLVTGLAFAVHYFSYKAMVVDESWVEERAQELNLKSYDRGHIEDLKARYGSDNPSERRRG